MLINTVILLLRDALPLILFFALLLLNAGKCIHLSSDSRTSLKGFYYHIFNRAPNIIFWGVALSFSVLTTSLLVGNLADISQKFGGKGNEILFSITLLIIYLLIVFILYLLHHKINITNNSRKTTISVIVVFILVFTLNATNFFTYILGFWSQPKLQFGLVIGIILGAGICISVSILFYFSLLLIRTKYQQSIIKILFLLFGCGQLIQALNLLLQVDLLPSYSALWDSSFIINEDGELGHFFTALVGYEATPSLLHLCVYCCALILPLVAYLYYFNDSEARYDLGAKNEES